MVEKPFAGPISRIFLTGIVLIYLMISLAVLQDIFGTDRSSQDVFILFRKFFRAGLRCEIRAISDINICNL